jgi:tetratricopeptide (TPR) repeat protein
MRKISIRFFGAAVLFAVGLQTQPSSAQTMQQLKMCMPQADPDLAIRVCSLFLETRCVDGRPLPKKAIWMTMGVRGSAYLKKLDYARTLADLNDMVALAPKEALVYAVRAAFYVISNDYERATADYAEALRLDPKNAHAKSGKRFLDHWVRYLREIQEDGDYANWSGPPLEVRNVK